MAYYCYKCRNEIEFIVKVGVKVGRLDTCNHCTAYMHVCKNCRFHDVDVHNQCRIPEADFIRDREAANFCHQFDIRDMDEPPEVDNTVEAAKAKLEDMFKKLK